MAQEKTKLDEAINWLKNHRFIWIVLLLGVVLIALGNAADAVSKIKALFAPSPVEDVGGSAVPIQSASDGSRLEISQVRFLNENPDKIDVLLKNVGNNVGILDKAVFTIHAVHRLTPNVSRTDALASSETYYVDFYAKETPYTVEVQCSQEIPAGEADRFQILIDAESSHTGEEYVYEFSIEFHFDSKTLSTKKLLYMEAFPSRYLPPPDMDEGTYKLLNEWTTSSHQAKSKKLVSLIEEFGP